MGLLLVGSLLLEKLDISNNIQAEWVPATLQNFKARSKSIGSNYFNYFIWLKYVLIINTFLLRQMQNILHILFFYPACIFCLWLVGFWVTEVKFKICCSEILDTKGFVTDRLDKAFWHQLLLGECQTTHTVLYSGQNTR
jgi:hypothetical protein